MANFHERMQQFFEHMRVHGEIGHKLTRCGPIYRIIRCMAWMSGW